MKNSFLILFLLFVPKLAIASGYIDATDEWPYTKVKGDGTEAGIVSEVTFESKTSYADVTVEFRFVEAAICEVESIEKVSSNWIEDGRYELTYFVKIKTEVLGDTGKCNIWIHADDTLMDVIGYSYVTDY